MLNRPLIQISWPETASTRMAIAVAVLLIGGLLTMDFLRAVADFQKSGNPEYAEIGALPPL
jgi:hypothetical protein